MKWKQTTLDVSRQNVNAAMAAMLASAAAVITNTGIEPEDINYTAVGSAVTTMWVWMGMVCSVPYALRASVQIDQPHRNGQGSTDAGRTYSG